jgi:hypothetical protein
VLYIICCSKREIGVLVLRLGGGCTLEYCKGVDLLHRLRAKFLKVEGKWAFMGVCVWDVWGYSGVKVE